MKLTLLIVLFSYNALAMGITKPNAFKKVADDAVEGMADASNGARTNSDGRTRHVLDSAMHQNSAKSAGSSNSDSDSIISKESSKRHQESNTDNYAGSLSSSGSDSDSVSSEEWFLGAKRKARPKSLADLDTQTDARRPAKRLKTGEGTTSQSEGFSDSESLHSTSDSDYSHSISDGDQHETFSSNSRPSPELIALLNKQKRLKRHFRLEYNVLQDLQTKFAWDQPYLPIGQLTVKEAKGASKAVNPLILKYVDAIMNMQNADYAGATKIYLKGSKDLQLSRETALLHHNAILDDQAALRSWFDLNQPNNKKKDLDLLLRNPTVDFSIQNNFALSEAVHLGDLDSFKKLLYKLRDNKVDKNRLLNEAIEMERPDFINYLIKSIEETRPQTRRIR